MTTAHERGSITASRARHSVTRPSGCLFIAANCDHGLSALGGAWQPLSEAVVEPT
jgi:hypothetical protein